MSFNNDQISHFGVIYPRRVSFYQVFFLFSFHFSHNPTLFLFLSHFTRIFIFSSATCSISSIIHSIFMVFYHFHANFSQISWYFLACRSGFMTFMPFANASDWLNQLSNIPTSQWVQLHSYDHIALCTWNVNKRFILAMKWYIRNGWETIIEHPVECI